MIKNENLFFNCNYYKCNTIYKLMIINICIYFFNINNLNLYLLVNIYSINN